MKKITLAFILILSVILTGCGGKNMAEDPAAGGEEKIGVLIYKYDDTYISTVRQALEAKAKGKATLFLNDGKGDQGTQNDQVDLLLQKDVDVLLVNMVDIGAASTVVNKAKAAGVPVIFFNREPDTNVIKSYDKARFVGTNAKDAGVIQGEIIVDLWKTGKYDKNGDGKMQYVMFKGEPDNPEAVARTEYSVKTIKENGIEVQELGLQVANWDTEQANRAMEAWITKFGDKIEMVISNNDGMAQGAIAALQAAGFNKGDENKFIPVVGVDATDAARELISKKYMSGTVLQDGDAMAQALITLAMNAAEDRDFIEGSNYKYDDTGVAVRIPYQPYTGE